MPDSLPAEFNADSSTERGHEAKHGSVLVEDSCQEEAYADRSPDLRSRNPGLVILESASNAENHEAVHSCGTEEVGPETTFVPSSQDEDDSNDVSIINKHSGEAATVVQAVTLQIRHEDKLESTGAVASCDVAASSDSSQVDDIVLSSQAEEMSASPVGSSPLFAASRPIVSTSQHLGTLHLSGECYVPDTCEDDMPPTCVGKIASNARASIVLASLTPGYSQTQDNRDDSSDVEIDDPYQMLKNTQTGDRAAVAAVIASPPLEASALHHSELNYVGSPTLLRPLSALVDSSVKKVKEWQHTYCAPAGSSMSSSDHSLEHRSESFSDGHQSASRDCAVRDIVTEAMHSPCTDSAKMPANVEPLTEGGCSSLLPSGQRLCASPVRSQDLCDQVVQQPEVQPLLSTAGTQPLLLRLSPTQQSQTQLSTQDSDSFALQIDTSIVRYVADDDGVEHSTSIFARTMHAAETETSKQQSHRERHPFSFSGDCDDSHRSSASAPNADDSPTLPLPEDQQATDYNLVDATAPQTDGAGNPENEQMTAAQQPLEESVTRCPVAATAPVVSQMPSVHDVNPSIANVAPLTNLGHSAVAVTANAHVDDDTEVMSYSDASTASEVVVLPSSQQPGPCAFGVRGSDRIAATSLKAERAAPAITGADVVKLLFDFATQPFCEEIFSRFLQRTLPAVTVSQVAEKAQRASLFLSKHEDAVEASNSSSPATTLSMGYHADVSSLSKTTSVSSTGSVSTLPVASVELCTDSVAVGTMATATSTQLDAYKSHSQSQTAVTGMPAPRRIPSESSRAAGLSGSGRRTEGIISSATAVHPTTPEGSSSNSSSQGTAASAVPGSTCTPLQLSDLSPVVKDRNSSITPSRLLHSTDGSASSTNRGGSAEKPNSAYSAELYTSVEDNCASANTSRGPTTPHSEKPLPKKRSAARCLSEHSDAAGSSRKRGRSSCRTSSRAVTAIATAQSEPRHPGLSPEDFLDLPLLNIWERPVRTSAKRSATTALSPDGEECDSSKRARQRDTARGQESLAAVSPGSDTSHHSGASPQLNQPRDSRAVRAMSFDSANAIESTTGSRIGCKVLAKWTDKRYYPGRIASIHGGRLNVSFDDGTRLRIREEDALQVSFLPPGQRVSARLPDGYYATGVVSEPADAGAAAGGSSDNYDITLDEGATLSFKWHQLSLDANQAAELRKRLQDKRTQEGSDQQPAGCSKQPVKDSEKHVKDSEKLVKDCMHAIVVIAAATAAVSTTAACASMATTPTSSSATKGLHRRTNPQRTSTPAQRRKGAPTAKESSSPIVSSLFPEVRESPRSRKPSAQRKTAKHGLFAGDIKGPVPPAGSTFLSGCTFLLTHIRKSEEVLKKERMLMSCAASGDSSDREEDVPLVPYDKEHLHSQIESAGGMVLETFSLEASVASAKGCCFLVSDMFQRTLKYLQCLAAGIPCVSNAWVRDCCREGRRLDYTPYQLPAGVCIQTNTLLEYSGKKDVFVGQRVLVSPEGSHKNFLEEWTSVLALAGAELISKWPVSHASGSSKSGAHVDKRLTVIVDAAMPLSPTIAKKAMSLSDAVVLATTEWVIQCLIQGKLLAFRAHPKFTPGTDSPGRSTTASVNSK